MPVFGMLMDKVSLLIEVKLFYSQRSIETELKKQNHRPPNKDLTPNKGKG
ncbi:hypothetical protein MPG67_00470 [Helicobacter pylori]|nr:hypothetical protein [Helicobacter pylori]UOS15905.1 hypothetical protein MPG85_00470 [Helicobacter pylori]UOS50921.1 hypothetical protein MPG67_00470 [Helicobacter pylori]